MSDRPQHQPRPLIDLAVSILIPSLVLMKLSAPERLGADGALLLALAFPLGWGALELIRYRKFNWIALLGLVSVLLTGGIGLLHLDTRWLAIKEAAVPGLLGIGPAPRPVLAARLLALGLEARGFFTPTRRIRR